MNDDWSRNDCSIKSHLQLRLHLHLHVDTVRDFLGIGNQKKGDKYAHERLMLADALNAAVDKVLVVTASAMYPSINPTIHPIHPSIPSIHPIHPIPNASH